MLGSSNQASAIEYILLQPNWRKQYIFKETEASVGSHLQGNIYFNWTQPVPAWKITRIEPAINSNNTQSNTYTNTVQMSLNN